MAAHTGDLLAYIDASPTPYHAVRETAARLAAAGFTALAEADRWELTAGSRHYVTRGDGSLIAFEVGTRGPEESGLRIVGAHTDSPNLRIKPLANVCRHGYRQLAVEPYGGVLLYTWLDRDLSLAGRVSLRAADGLRSTLIDFARPVLKIPSLAIHLQREIHEDGLKLNPQAHLVPVLGLDAESGLGELLVDELARAEGIEVDADDITSYDLMTYAVEPAAVGGADGELLFAARLDNLASCHAALAALLASSGGGAGEATRIIVLYDHEEVGSSSAHGAGGTFLLDTIERLVATATADPQARARALSLSTLISVDMAHALHPNHADKHEPGHRPLIGGGPVIKHNANLAYASDAKTVGLFTELCRGHEIQPQHFVVRSDLPCGSTIGPITAARVGIRTVDVGNPMLAMHSCRETAGTADVEPMIDVLTAYLSND